MMKCLQLLVAGSICLFLVPGCKSRGNLETVSFKGNRVAIIALGLVENRDLRYENNAAQDLADLFAFELQKAGYQVQTVDTAQFDRLEQTTSANSSKKKEDETSDLMPEYMRSLAGERSVRVLEPSRSRTLSNQEIRKLAANVPFQYFVQGVVSRNETGNLVEPEESYLVLLNIFGNDGQRAGGVSFTVRNNPLADATFLKQVCKRMAEGFDSTIHRGNVVQRGYSDRVSEWLGL